MKKKQLSGILVCAVMVVVMVCVITACGGGAGGGTPAMTLEELTAALAAAAPGDTVVLTSRVMLTGSLTVRDGVTLDMTAAKAALVLGNNAIFTVDGTVHAKGTTGLDSYGIVLMPGETIATIKGSGDIRLKTQGLLLSVSSGQKLILDGNVTYDGLWKIADDGTDPLDTMNNINDLVLVKGELEMNGGTITGNYNANDWDNNGDGIDGGGVEVNGEGNTTATFTMSGSAEVSGNRAKLDGGGVNVCHGGKFIMKDNAKVSNNIADRSGGGVRVRQDTYPATSFTLEGGTVTGNTAYDIGEYGGPGSNSLIVYTGTAKWGTTSTKISGGNGGQSPGGDILSGGIGTTNDDLSAEGP